MSFFKSNRKWILLWIVILVCGFLFYPVWRPGPLLRLAKQLDAAAVICEKTGSDQAVSFHSPDSNATVVLSPPYATIAGEEGGRQFPAEVAKQMQDFVDSQETGHLFYLKDGIVADHRLLTGLAEPLYGIGKGAQIQFLVSRETTSGRPVRIEITP